MTSQTMTAIDTLTTAQLLRLSESEAIRLNKTYSNADFSSSYPSVTLAVNAAANNRAIIYVEVVFNNDLLDNGIASLKDKPGLSPLYDALTDEKTNLFLTVESVNDFFIYNSSYQKRYFINAIHFEQLIELVKNF